MVNWSISIPAENDSDGIKILFDMKHFDWYTTNSWRRALARNVEKFENLQVS